MMMISGFRPTAPPMACAPLGRPTSRQFAASSSARRNPARTGRARLHAGTACRPDPAPPRTRRSLASHSSSSRRPVPGSVRFVAQPASDEAQRLVGEPRAPGWRWRPGASRPAAWACPGRPAVRRGRRRAAGRDRCIDHANNSLYPACPSPAPSCAPAPAARDGRHLAPRRADRVSSKASEQRTRVGVALPRPLRPRRRARSALCSRCGSAASQAAPSPARRWRFPRLGQLARHGQPRRAADLHRSASVAATGHAATRTSTSAAAPQVRSQRWRDRQARRKATTKAGFSSDVTPLPIRAAMTALGGTGTPRSRHSRTTRGPRARDR